MRLLPQSRRATAALTLITVALAACTLVFTAPVGGAVEHFVVYWLYNPVVVAAGLVCVARGVASSRERARRTCPAQPLARRRHRQPRGRRGRNGGCLSGRTRRHEWLEGRDRHQPLVPARRPDDDRARRLGVRRFRLADRPCVGPDRRRSPRLLGQRLPLPLPDRGRVVRTRGR